jgi:hypothetical protein
MVTDTDKLIDQFQMNISNSLNQSLTKLKADINQIAGQVNTLVDSFDTSYDLTTYNQLSPNGIWKNKGTGYGKIYSMNGALTMYPKTSTAPDQTSAPLVISTKQFGNCTLEVDCKLNKQLRTGSPPNLWETFWLFRSYWDEQEGPLKRSNHHYYFLLKPDGIDPKTNKPISGGWEFGKKDNKPGDVTNEQQIYIADKRGVDVPKAKLGQWYHIFWDFKDFHHVIKVDGVTVVDMQDPVVNDPAKMAVGYIGLYNEDSNTSFDNVLVRPN